METLRMLARYNGWANQKLVRAASRTSPDAWTTPVVERYGGLGHTLHHLAFGQMAWLRIISGDPLPVAEMTVDQLRNVLLDVFEAADQAVISYLRSIKPSHLDDLVKVATKRRRTRRTCLAHMLNHSAQHRAEAAMLSTAAGQSPGNLDIVFFDNDEQRARTRL